MLLSSKRISPVSPASPLAVGAVPAVLTSVDVTLLFTESTIVVESSPNTDPVRSPLKPPIAVTRPAMPRLPVSPFSLSL